MTLLVLFGGRPLIAGAFADQSTAFRPLRFPVTNAAPGRLKTEAELGQGKFLIAGRNLGNSNFSQTVVLLIDYNRQGAMGLIINRPTDVKLSTVFPEIEGLKQRTDTVFSGGPVSRNLLLLLMRSARPPEKSRRVFENIYLSSSRKELLRMIERADGGEKFRVYAGYAGWAPGQLDHEVARGDWHILAADAETVFDKTPSAIWPELIRRFALQWVRGQEPRRAFPDGALGGGPGMPGARGYKRE
ncbi:MAG: YqgE/AlgH family protein [Desulfobacterales bacterium]|nr:MAG: YqgE/AlgH family protein [Desulfobacterales bacterium]